MGIVEKIKSNPRLKRFANYCLMPKNQARPRLWVTLVINPFIHHKGKRSLIRRRTRMDVLPFNMFSIGNDSTIEDFTTINNGVGDIIIGDRTRIGLGCTLIGPVKIGNDIRLAQNIVMSGLNHNYEDVTIPITKQGVSTALIIIEDETWIGANCVVLPGVTIGKHCVIAAGSIVTRDIPPFSVAAGNPAKILKQYNPEMKIWERK